MTASRIAEALSGRKCGAGWMCKCPAHKDRSPSLSLRDGDGGRVLVHCHAGCPQQTVIEALRAKGLWPERERRDWTPAERQRYARARREAPALARRAAWWLWAKLAQLDRAKLAAVNGDSLDVDRLAAAACEHHLLRSASAAGVIAAYMRALIVSPTDTARLVAAGRAHDGDCRAIVNRLLDKIRSDQDAEARRAA